MDNYLWIIIKGGDFYSVIQVHNLLKNGKMTMYGRLTFLDIAAGISSLLYS